MSHDQFVRRMLYVRAAWKRAGHPLFLGIPESWYGNENRPKFRCFRNHVSRYFIKSELNGDTCPSCGEGVMITFPEDRDGDFFVVWKEIDRESSGGVHEFCPGFSGLSCNVCGNSENHPIHFVLPPEEVKDKGPIVRSRMKTADPQSQNPLVAVYSIRVDVRGTPGAYTASTSLIEDQNRNPIFSGSGSKVAHTPDEAVRIALLNLTKNL